jgi:DNA-binding winged helix-turn-helix (wHTH) protein
MSQHSGSNVTRFPSPAAGPAAIGRMTFEGFVLDRQAGQLSREGEAVALAPQPFKLLEYFVSHPGRLISRDELQEQVWGRGTFVDFERGLNFCILQIRTALGDDARAPRFIETVPRRGYRFVAQVVPDSGARIADPAASANIPRSRWILSTAAAFSVMVSVLATAALLNDALRVAKPQPRVINTNAHDQYLRGRNLWNQRRTPDVRASIGHYRKALEHDPRFGLAWVGIAESQHLLQLRGQAAPLDAREEIRIAVEQALRAEPSLASAHSAAGTLAFWYDWDWAGAERHFRQSLQLSDSDAGAHHDLGWLLISRGRPEEGVEEIMRAQQFDPISPRANIDIAWSHIYTGQFDRAIAEARRTLERYPDFEEAYRCMERAYLMKGDFAGAVDAARHRMTALGRTADLASLQSLAPRDAVQEIRRINLRRLEQQTATGWVDPYAVAAEHAFLGHAGQALAFLERAIESRSTNIPLMAVDPMLRSLRGDARFQRLLLKVGLKPDRLAPS